MGTDTESGGGRHFSRKGDRDILPAARSGTADGAGRNRQTALSAAESLDSPGGQWFHSWQGGPRVASPASQAVAVHLGDGEVVSLVTLSGA